MSISNKKQESQEASHITSPQPPPTFSLFFPSLFSTSHQSADTQAGKRYQDVNDLRGTAYNALQADLYVIQAALLWISNHPQLAPLFYTFGKYAANCTLTSCFSKGTCQNCNKCLHLLGLDIDRVGVTDLCESALMSAYSEAIHHPFYSMQMASKGINLIKQGISGLANMPEQATQHHKDLAKFIKSIENLQLLSPNISFQNIWNKGYEIYKESRAIAWLYVGLPEVFAKVRQRVTQDEAQIEDIITEVYSKWRKWGQEQKIT